MLFILLLSGFATLSFTLSDLRCQRGWSLFGSRCYKIYTTATSWNAAEKNCVSLGGHLASVHNKEQYAFIQALVLNATKSNAQTWIGATTQVGDWTWTDGSAFGYINWSPGEPDNFYTEKCLEMNYGVGWNDRTCEYLDISACVKPAFHAKIVSVIRIKIISKEDLLESETIELGQMVRKMLINSGMPADATFRLRSIHKNST